MNIIAITRRPGTPSGYVFFFDDASTIKLANVVDEMVWDEELDDFGFAEAEMVLQRVYPGN